MSSEETPNSDCPEIEIIDDVSIQKMSFEPKTQQTLIRNAQRNINSTDKYACLCSPSTWAEAGRACVAAADKGPHAQCTFYCTSTSSRTT